MTLAESQHDKTWAEFSAIEVVALHGMAESKTRPKELLGYLASVIALPYQSEYSYVGRISL